MNVCKKQLRRIPPHEYHERAKYGRNEKINQAGTDEILGKRTHNVLLNSFANRLEWIIIRLYKNTEKLRIYQKYGLSNKKKTMAAWLLR